MIRRATAGAAVLEVKDAHQRYGRHLALDGVGLSLAPGEIYALLGPNGAGKSTLVRAICGRRRPTAGQIRVQGQDPYAERSARAALGLVPQELALYPHLTVRESLRLFARLSGVGRRDAAAAVERALRLTLTFDHASARVSALSGGYQRRVNIAAAIVHRPALLILDEPTVGVDITSRAALNAVIRGLADEGVAVLIVTHDLEEAAALATRVGFLIEGRLALEGRPRDLLAEAFGDRLEVTVILAGEAAADEAAILRALGFLPDDTPGAWSMQSPDGHGLVARVDADLRAVGRGAAEVRLRQPSLKALWRRIAEPGAGR